MAQSGSWQSFLQKNLSDMPVSVRPLLNNSAEVSGVFEDHSLTLWASTEMVKGILGRPATVKKLEAAAEAFTGSPKRVSIRVGTPPPASADSSSQTEMQQKDPLDDLLALGQKFGNFKITEREKENPLWQKDTDAPP